MPSGRLRTAGPAVALLGLALAGLAGLAACTPAPIGSVPVSTVATAGQVDPTAFATATGQVTGPGDGLPSAVASPGLDRESPTATGHVDQPDPEMTTIGAASACTDRTQLGDRAPVRPEQLFARGGESGFDADLVVVGPGARGGGSCVAQLPAAPDCELSFPWAGVDDEDLLLATGARSLLVGRVYARVAESSNSVGGTASLLYTVLDLGGSPDRLADAYEWFAGGATGCGIGKPGSVGGVTGVVGSGHRPTLLSTVPGRFLLTEDGSRVVVLVFQGGAWSDDSRASATRRVMPLLRGG
jgi:hypothetical protein